MPQLDPSSFSSQLFWLTVSFVVLYMLLARILLPRVQSVLDMRSQTIEGDIAQAERMKSEAEQASVDYEKALADARAKSHATLLQAQGELAARAARRQSELDAAIDRKMEESETAIASAKRAVEEKLSPVAGELASLIVEMLVQQKPASKDIGAAISGIAKERSL